KAPSRDVIAHSYVKVTHSITLPHLLFFFYIYIYIYIYIYHHHHHHRLASVFPCLHGSDVAPKIFLLHNSLSLVSSTFNPNRFISLLTHSLHVFLLLPLPTLPSTPRFKHFLTQSSSDFLSTCPYHLSLP